MILMRCHLPIMYLERGAVSPPCRSDEMIYLPLIFSHPFLSLHLFIDSRSLLHCKTAVAVYWLWIMRLWRYPFSPRRTELTSGLFGRLVTIGLVGKPLQCYSRCRQGRPSAHRWRHTNTTKLLHTQHTHILNTISQNTAAHRHREGCTQ